MATTTFQHYNGDGSNKDFNYSFPTFTASEVVVEVDGVVVDNFHIVSYSTSGTNTVRFDNGDGQGSNSSGTINNSVCNSTTGAPLNNKEVIVRRDTNVDTAKATFTAGSSLKAADLTNTVTHILRALQEEQNTPTTTPRIRNAAITTAKIKADNITSALIADDQIDSEHLVADSIDTEHYAPNSVDTAALAADAVTGAQIGDSQINSEHYVDGSIDREHLAGDIVNGSKIADNSIDSEHYVDGSIDSVHLANSAIGSNQIANNAVTSTEILNGAVIRDKLATDAVDGTKLADNAVNSEHYTDGSIDRVHLEADIIDSTKLADNAVNSEHYVDGSIDHVHLANDIIDGDNIQDDVVNSEHIAAGALDNEHYAAGSITSDKLNGATVVTNSEQAASTPNDTSFFTTAAAEARYFNASTGETIKDGQSFPDNDTTIATTAAINDRIIDLVDDVGGFVPIANETSFPTSNPDVNDGAGTIVSVSAASTNLVPSGTTVTIANGRGSGLAVIITGVSATIPSGFGFLVETTTTDHTYAFHRLSPKATEVTTVAGISTNITAVANNETNINAVKNNETNINAVKNNETNINAVAGKATEIGRLGTIAAVADMAILGTADVVADMAILGTNDVVADLNTLGTADVVADLNTLGTADVVSDMNALATTNNITAMDTCKDNIASINNCSSNISSVNTFGDQYQVNNNDPSTDGGGNQLAPGDLYFNTSANELKVYNGSSWQGGVTASGNFASVTGNTFTGDNRYNDDVKAKFGTNSDLEIYGIASTGTAGIINHANGDLLIKHGADKQLISRDDGSVELYYDDSKKLETTSTGATLTGDLTVTGTFPKILLTDTDHNPDYSIINANGEFKIFSETDSVSRIKVKPNGTVEVINDLQIPNDTGKIELGASQDFEIFHNGSQNVVGNTTTQLRLITDQLRLRSSTGSETYAQADVNGGFELFHNNIKKFETTSAGVDVTGNIIATGQIKIDGDGGSKYISVGDNEDLKIYHDASGPSIIADNQNQGLKISAKNLNFTEYTGVTTRFRINDDGHVDVTGNLDVGSGLDVTGNITVTGTVDGVDIDALNTTVGTKFSKAGGDTITGDFTIASGTTNKNINVDVSTRVRFDDNLEATFGNDNNLKIYHTGSHSYIDQTASSGDLYIRQYGTSNSILFNGANSETMAKFTHNGSCELYHNNVNTFKTDTNGILVKGPENDYGAIFLYADEGDDDADKWAMFALASGGFKLQNYTSGSWETNIIANGNGDVELYYDNSKKFETNSLGAKISSSAAARLNIVSADDQSAILRLGPTSDDDAVQIWYDDYANALYYRTSTNTPQIWYTNNTQRLVLQNDGHLRPYADSSYDLGVTGTRWRNVYADTYYGDGSNLTGINTDLVSDTTPQLGGNLDSNSKNINFGDSSSGSVNRLNFGAGTDMNIYHNSSIGNIIKVADSEFLIRHYGENMIVAKPNLGVELFYDNSLKLQTTADGVVLNGASDISHSSADNLQVGTGSGSNGITIYSGTSDNGSIYFGDGSSSTEPYRGFIEYSHSSDYMSFGSAGTTAAYFDNNGHFLPVSNNTKNLGSSSKRWANLYVNDMHFANSPENVNCVDGTWGDWTLQEGEETIYMINNRNGKKYKMSLQEVS